MTSKDDIIRSSLKSARDWDAKGDANWSSRCYSAALIAMLSKAVTDCTGAQDGVRALESDGARACLGDAHRALTALRGDILAGKLPWSAIGGNYALLVHSHVAELLGERGISADLLALAAEEELLRLSGKFWKAYAQGLVSLVNGREWPVPTLTVKGPERHWFPYLRLMSVIAAGRDAAEAVEEVDASFRARNQDKRLHHDSYEIEGAGRHPVRWDFRKDAILQAAKVR